MKENFDIDYGTVQEIIVNAYDTCKKRSAHTGSDDVTIDLLTILHSYGEVLSQKNIDTSKDTGYYKFLLDLSVENNKLREPDWFRCFEKLKRKNERHRIIAMQYHRSLYCRAFASLCYNARIKRNNDISRLSMHNKKTEKLKKIVKVADKDVMTTTKPQHIRKKSSKISFNLEREGSDKENYSLKSEPLSFMEGIPEKDTKSVLKERSFLAPLDVNVMNLVNDVEHTPYLGKNTGTDSGENDEVRLEESGVSTDLGHLGHKQRVSRTTAMDTSSSNRMRTKESVRLSTSEMETRKEEALKDMSKVFFRWAMYVQKKKENREEKDVIVKKTVKAMEYNYQTLLMKGFISLGFLLMKRRKVKNNYRVIRERYEVDLKKKTLNTYRIAFEKHVIRRLLKEKARRLSDKKLLKRQFDSWKLTTSERSKMVKPLQTVWQAKLMVYILCMTYNISMKDPYEVIFTKVSQKIHCPRSKEDKLLDAITLINEDLQARAFEFWKAYIRKCLDSKNYHNQRIKREGFLFWKHYSTKRHRIRQGEELLCNRRTSLLKGEIIKRWSSLTASKKKLSRTATSITKKITFQLKQKYYDKWTALYTNSINEREDTSFSDKYYAKNIKRKVFRLLRLRVFAQIKKREDHINAVSYRKGLLSRKIFGLWERFTYKSGILRQKAEETAYMRNTHLKKTYMRVWRSGFTAAEFYNRSLKSSLFRALEKIRDYNDKILQKAEDFYNRIEDKKDRVALTRGFTGLKKKLMLNRLGEQLAQEQELRVMKACMNIWREGASEELALQRKLELIQQLLKDKELPVMFRKWVQYVKKQKKVKLAMQKASIMKRGRLIGACYEQWRDAYMENRRERYGEEVFEKVYCLGLVRKAFGSLSEAYVQDKEKYERAVEYESTRKLTGAFEWLRTWTNRNKAVRYVQEEAAMRLIASVFDNWREEYMVFAGSKTLVEKKTARVMRAAFDTLYEESVMGKKLRALEVLGEKYGDKEVLRVFMERWRTNSDAKTRQLALLKVFTADCERRLLGKSFSLLHAVMIKKKKLRKMDEELVGFFEDKMKHQCFKVLKENAEGTRERIAIVSWRVRELKVNSLDRVFKAWREYSQNRKMQRMRVEYMETKRVMRLAEMAFYGLWEECTARKAAQRISENLGRDERCNLENVFGNWKNFVIYRKEKNYKVEQVMEYREITLKKRALDVMAVLKTKRRFKEYQESLARHFVMKKVFQGFMRGVFMQLEKRHGKIQGLRHYALNLMMKSMLEWKMFVKERIEERYKKIMKPMGDGLKQSVSEMSESIGYTDNNRESSQKYYEGSPTYQETSLLYSKESSPWH